MFFLLLLCFGVSRGISSFHLMEKSNYQRLPSSYIAQRNRADPNVQHEVQFYIKYSNFSKLEDLLIQVSDPRLPTYGHHLNRDQLSSQFSKAPASILVQSFLRDQSIEIVKVSKYHDFIVSRAPISRWESIFQSSFYEFQYLHGQYKGQIILRSLEYSLPDELLPHVFAVFNTVQIPVNTHSHAPKMIQYSPSHLKGLTSAGSVTPALLNSYYSITSNTGSSLVSQAVYESLNQSTSPSDLSTFQSHFSLPLQGLARDIGGHVFNAACNYDKKNDCIEANLDVQYIMAVSQVTPTTYYYDNSSDFLLTWSLEVAQMSDPPLVFSISYGEDESFLSASYMSTFDQQAITLGVMGITVMASSGDSGALPSGITLKAQCQYAPQFPASSPYITAVGATQGPESGTSEVVCQSNNNPSGVITSGGGFSSTYPMPSWQASQVSQYFSSVSTPPVSGYSVGGRGYPDVSMLGFNYQVVLGGGFYLVSGTSASSPVFAGLVSLVNAVRYQSNPTNASSLGWLNPSLYLYASNFTNDITSGNNKCGSVYQTLTGYTEICCTEGYQAAPGWDPVSGLGSVNFQKFRDVFLSLAEISVPTSSPTTYNVVNSAEFSLISIGLGLKIGISILVIFFVFGLVSCCYCAYKRNKNPMANDDSNQISMNPMA